MSFYDDYEIEQYEKITEDIKSIIAEKKLTKVNINEINIDDMVYITFYPCSQKYIYSLVPKIGKVVSIENKDFINYNNEEEKCLILKLKIMKTNWMIYYILVYHIWVIH